MTTATELGVRDAAYFRLSPEGNPWVFYPYSPQEIFTTLSALRNSGDMKKFQELNERRAREITKYWQGVAETFVMAKRQGLTTTRLNDGEQSIHKFTYSFRDVSQFKPPFSDTETREFPPGKVRFYGFCDKTGKPLYLGITKDTGSRVDLVRFSDIKGEGDFDTATPGLITIHSRVQPNPVESPRVDLYEFLIFNGRRIISLGERVNEARRDPSIPPTNNFFLC